MAISGPAEAPIGAAGQDSMTLRVCVHRRVYVPVW